MKRLATITAAAASVVCVATAASAADAVLVVPTTSPAVLQEPTNVAAMVEVFGGVGHMGLGDVNDTGCQGCHEVGAGFGGEGRAAMQLGPSLSLQLNVWAEHWSGRSFFGDCRDWREQPWSVNRMGIGTHLTYDTGSFQFGGFASLGARTSEGIFLGFYPGTYANFGLEGAFNAAKFRVYGQAGYTIPLAPVPLRDLWASGGIRDFYGRLVGTFYPNPNIALSANVGFEILTGTDFWLPANLLTWGCRGAIPAGRKASLFPRLLSGLTRHRHQRVSNRGERPPHRSWPQRWKSQPSIAGIAPLGWRITTVPLV